MRWLALPCQFVRQPAPRTVTQRYVDLREVNFYEHLGICFGREPQDVELECVEEEGAIERMM